MLNSITRRFGPKKKNVPKIFVIGFNKTGTTSIKFALKQLNFNIGSQAQAELTMEDVMVGDFTQLMKLIENGQAFQDVPFSMPGVYKKIHSIYPNAKFILSVRTSSEEWYNSLSMFHSKIWGKGKLPTKEDLTNADYRYQGFALKYIEAVFGRTDYDSDHYKKIYELHNNNVRQYFSAFPDNFLEINVADAESYTRMCEFLNVVPLDSSFEWKNKTHDLK